MGPYQTEKPNDWLFRGITVDLHKSFSIVFRVTSTTF